MNILSNEEIIAYTVDKTSNSSLYISIQNGEVIVKAPWYYTKSQIQKVVEEKKNWILKHIKEYNEAENIKKEKANNKPIEILGRKYDLLIKYENLNNPTLNLFRNYIEIILPLKYQNLPKDDIIKMTLNKMYKSIAKNELDILMEDARHLFGYAPEDYKIKDLDDCLAKCSNNIIYINPEIMKYNNEIIRFIIIHQFCHLKYKNHTKGFYELMERNIFNYDEVEKQAKKLKF